MKKNFESLKATQQNSEPHFFVFALVFNVSAVLSKYYVRRVINLKFECIFEKS